MSQSTHQATRDAVLLLLSRGERPTWRAVREITNSGSSSDITRRISEVLTELAERSLHNDYPEEVQSAFLDLWRAAKAAAAAEFDAHRIACEERAAAAQSDQQHALEELAQVRRELALASQQVTEQSRVIEFLRQGEMDAQDARKQLEEQLLRSQRELDETRQQARVQVEKLENSLRQARDQHQDALRAVRDAANQETEALKAELLAANTRYTTDTASLYKKIDAERQERRADAAAAHDAQKALREQIENLQGRCRFAVEEAARLKGAHEALEGELGRAQAREQAATAKAAAAEAEQQKLGAALLHQQKEISVLQATISEQAQRIEALGQENARLNAAATGPAPAAPAQ